MDSIMHIALQGHIHHSFITRRRLASMWITGYSQVLKGRKGTLLFPGMFPGLYNSRVKGQ